MRCSPGSLLQDASYPHVFASELRFAQKRFPLFSAWILPTPKHPSTAIYSQLLVTIQDVTMQDLIAGEAQNFRREIWPI
jgi:hypothetical protein